MSFAVYWAFAGLTTLTVITLASQYDYLNAIPGPFFARWSPLWLAYHTRIGRRYQAVHEAHKRYGQFVRISPNHVSVSHPDAVSVIYGHGTGALDKSSFYDAFVSRETSVFSTTNRADHARKRRNVSQAFSCQSLQQFYPFMKTILGDFVVKLDELGNGDAVDLLLLFNYLAFDVLSDLAFGEAIGMVVRNTDVVTIQLPDGSVTNDHAIRLVDDREHLAALVGLHWSFKFLSRFIPDPFFIRGRNASSGLETLARAQVSKRLESGIQRKDILGHLINARVQDHQDASSLDPSQIDQLTAEAVTLLIAGSDTTSNSMAAILYLVLTHQDVYGKLMTEIANVIQGTHLPSYQQVKNMLYLEAVINEGLRFHAITAIGLPRTVPTGGLSFEGRYFPAGTEMSSPAWTIQHDQHIWHDPECFRPERWMEPDSKRLHKFLLSFGKGPRACLGRNLAYMEMSLTLATILNRYIFTLQDETLETTEGFMHKPSKLMVKFRRRW